jgi:hypothetical protein
MAVFHSMTKNAIMATAAAGQTVSGDLYFATDFSELYIAATDGSVAPVAGILMQGGITGEPGPAGPASTVPGPQGPIGPAGAGSTNNVAVESGDYTAPTTVNTILCTGAVIQNITLTTDGLTVGQIYTVTVLITAKQVNVVAQHGEAIEGDTGGAILFRGDSAGFMWTGSGFVIQ